ncbi:MAG: hypothetical protein ABIP12_03180, partial [Terriglobales bacterium]
MRYSITGACHIEGAAKVSPLMAVPMTVKMPEPMTAPMPSEMSATGPSVFFRRVSGFSESEMSLSMDFRAKSWLAMADSWGNQMRHPR